ncbi:S1 RNA-binding domain-containing protein [Streptomyces sp. ID01-9D]|nr:S1 RNA-binding domain-containing protein [Streptomyces sp. ID01-9D]
MARRSRCPSRPCHHRSGHQADPVGAFIRIADGIEGLVHNTQFRDEPVEDPGQIVSEGDEITVRIVEVDLVHRRLALSARNLPQSGKRST